LNMTRALLLVKGMKKRLKQMKKKQRGKKRKRKRRKVVKKQNMSRSKLMNKVRN